MTYPGSRHLFPTPVSTHRHPMTGEAPTPDPRRRPWRHDAHAPPHPNPQPAKAIAAERRLNDPLIAERNKPPPF